MELRTAVDAHDYYNKVPETDIHPLGMLNLSIHKGLVLISARIMTKPSYAREAIFTHRDTQFPPRGQLIVQ